MTISEAVSKLLQRFQRSYLLGSNARPATQPRLSQPEMIYPRQKPVFDINKVVVEPAQLGHVGEIEQFLLLHYFMYEPTIRNLGIKYDSKYLTTLARKYSTSGDRWLAYEIEPKMRKRTLLGTLVANKKFPNEVSNMQSLAAMTPQPDSYHVYFGVFCIQASDVFTKYRIPYVYDIELLAVNRNVMGLGVESLLLQTVFKNAYESDHSPLIQVFSTNTFLNAACEQAGMALEWSMKLADFTNEKQESLFYSKVEEDDATVNLYIRLFSPKKGQVVYHPQGLVRQNPMYT